MPSSCRFIEENKFHYDDIVKNKKGCIIFWPGGLLTF